MPSDWEPEQLEPQDVFTWQEPQGPAEPPAPAVSGGRRRPGRRAVLAVVGACALSGIGAGVAAAATSGSTPPSGSSGSSGSTTPPANPRPFLRHGFGGPGMGGLGGPGMGGAIRGEFVRPDPSGSGYQTVDFQVGKVTSDAPYTSSISVTSSDGTTKTYDVTTNTLVDAGRDGVGNISNGDTVTIEAVVVNGTATARTINDQTRLGQLRQAWGYGPPPSPGTTPPSPSGT